MTSTDLNGLENPEDRILAGRTVLVTRPRDQAGELVEQLTKRGAEVLLQPAIEIEPIWDWQSVDQAIRRIDEFDWLTFVSVNGVKYFLERCKKLKVDLNSWSQNPSLKFAAIGQRTARELENRGLDVSLIPSRSDSSGVAMSLIKQTSKTNKVLIVRADRGSEELSARLTEAGVSHDQVTVYRSLDVTEIEPEIKERLEQKEIDWMTITSSAIGQSAVHLFGELLRQVKLASISPTTTQKLRELDFPPAAEATEFNMSGLVQAIVDYETSQQVE